MSYILDALRRADAERQRGAVPGLHDQPALMGPAADQRMPRSVPLAWVLAAGVLLALALALGWWQAGQGRPLQPVEPGPAQAGAGAAPALPASAPPASAMPMPVVAVAPPPAPATVAALPAPTTAVNSTGTTTVTVTVNGPAATAPTRVAVVAAPPANAVPVPAKPAPAAQLTADTPVPALASLPEALRRQLPPLALGGGVYAEQPAQRLVLVNGQVAHEGDELGRGLRLVQIRPRSVVFSFAETLFELAL